jgi:hypothetical protein
MPREDNCAGRLLHYEVCKQMISYKIHSVRWRPPYRRKKYNIHHGDGRSFGTFLIHLDDRLVDHITDDQWQSGFIALYHARQIGLSTKWQFKPQFLQDCYDTAFKGQLKPRQPEIVDFDLLLWQVLVQEAMLVCYRVNQV